MAIELACPGCNNRLRVADNTAGQQAKCPSCETVFQVSADGVAQSNPPQAAPPPDRAPAASAEMWRLKIPTGSTFGPISRQELESWVAQGRVTGDSQLLREGDQEWQWARAVFPQLGVAATAAAPGANPYASPNVGGAGTRRTSHQVAHRGGLVLAFGIIGFFFFFCGIILGPMAWALGRADLKEMRAGRMDPTGEGITQAGMICGIIVTTIYGLVFLCLVPLFVCAGIAG